MAGRIGGWDLRRMIGLATGYLERHRAEVDQLNVFPVPDGDTGTNLLLTMRSAQAEMDRVNSSSLGEMSGALARGSLLGARGNSGVILSQIFRGLARTFEGKGEADGLDLGLALQEGVQAAYRAVVRPVEGTILTVAREAARRAVEVGKRTRDAVVVLREAWNGARETLGHTPDLLPVLKRAGVVDAGGQGLVYILEGLLAALVGEEGSAQMVEPQPVSVSAMGVGAFPYDVVATVRVRGRWSRLRQELAALGDSLVLAEEDEFARVHLHTASPDRVVALLMDEGLAELRVEDMRLQVEAHTGAPFGGSGARSDDLTRVAVVAVAPGDGWAEVLASLGAAVVAGGPTMNPSASELMEAVRQARAREVVVLPGHPNAWAVARQVASLSRMPVRVVSALSPAQAVAAALAFNPEVGGSENVAAMQEAAGRVKTLQVTRAVRDAAVEDVPVRRGDVVGFLEEDLVVVAPTCEEAVLALLERAVTGEMTAVTLFYGVDVDGARAAALADRVRSRYPGLLVEVHYGGQPLQHYVISVE
ncbi:MAG: DAK2 domain-containing protein [Bacillota bacterium]|nr:DAK2 domain-containing protein [Bacillota bacterium]